MNPFPEKLQLAEKLALSGQKGKRRKKAIWLSNAKESRDLQGNVLTADGFKGTRNELFEVAKTTNFPTILCRSSFTDSVGRSALLHVSPSVSAKLPKQK